MPLNTKISQIMSNDVFTVDISDTIHKADEIMRNEHIKHVPVVENNKFIGMITERSLMEYTLRQLYDYDDEFGEEGYNAITDFQNIMTKEVYLIYPEDSVRKAVEIMAKKRTDCLAVVDWEKNLVGIVTSSDILMYIHKKLLLEEDKK